MTSDKFFELLEASPVVAAVKDAQGLERALRSACTVIFALYGDILSIADITNQVNSAGKSVFVHVDLIEGLAARDVSIDYIAKHTKADGILSTKSNLIRRAGICGLLAIQRFFLLDSMALENARRQYTAGGACAVEILPGIIPKLTAQLACELSVPVIAGGLVTDKDDVTAALGAGARAVSTTNPEIWPQNRR